MQKKIKHSRMNITAMLSFHKQKDKTKNKRTGDSEMLVLIVNVLTSKIFQSKKKALIEDLDYMTYSLVQSNMVYTFVPANYFYENLKYDIGLMISHVAEFLKENELWGRTDALVKKCEYYQKYLISIRDYSIHANFRVNICHTLPSNYGTNDCMSAKECYERILAMINETYFSLFGYPFCTFFVLGDFAMDHDNNGSEVPFFPTGFIFGPKNKPGKKRF